MNHNKQDCIVIFILDIILNESFWTFLIKILNERYQRKVQPLHLLVSLLIQYSLYALLITK